MQKIGNFESLVYFIIWITANFYSLYKLYEAQDSVLEKNPQLRNRLHDLVPGWNLLARSQDVSDIEWNTWKYFLKLSWLHLLIQFIISELIRSFKPSLINYWYFLSTFIFFTVYLNIKQFLILFCEPLMYGLITFSGGRRKCLWLISILMLVASNYFKHYNVFWIIFDHKNSIDEQVYLLLFAIAWVQLRCISFCLDYVERVEKLSQIEDKCMAQESNLYNFMKLLNYVFYLPTLHPGPVILYSDFEKSYTARNGLYSRIKSFVWNMAVFLTYTFLLDYSFHHIYFLAMQEKMELIRQLPTMALCGGGLWMGLEFLTKYVIFYGITGAYASLDNIEAPPTPRCIARVHIYSQMWRYFDVGLYKFLIRYIYLPSLKWTSSFKAIPKPVQKLMASSVAFCFIFLWHGISRTILVWSILNFIAIAIESMARVLSETDSYKNFKVSVLKTGSMEQRFIAVICTPLLALSAISNFYLFGGYKVGDLFFESLLRPSLRNSVIVLVSLYSCCHVSMALKDVPSRTAKRKISV